MAQQHANEARKESERLKCQMMIVMVGDRKNRLIPSGGGDPIKIVVAGGKGWNLPLVRVANLHVVWTIMGKSKGKLKLSKIKVMFCSFKITL